MKTEIFKVTDNSIKELNYASKLLNDGELVAIPTETVYGLGANALNKNAWMKQKVHFPLGFLPLAPAKRNTSPNIQGHGSPL